VTAVAAAANSNPHFSLSWLLILDFLLVPRNRPVAKVNEN